MRHCIQLILAVLLILISSPVSYALKIVSVPRSVKKSLFVISWSFLSLSNAAYGVSGGGFDFATKNLKEEGDFFVGKTFKEKDFTQCDASGVSFKNSVLTGSRFYRAKLFDTDFTGADLSAVSLEDTGLTGAIFTDAKLEVCI